MTVIDKKNELPNRPNLQRLLYCRPSDQIIYYGLLIITVFYFSVIFINTLLLSATNKMDLQFDELLIHYVVVILLGLFTQFNIRKKIFTQIHLLSQGMNIEYKRNKTFIPYEDIEQITPPSLLETLRLTSYRIVLKNGKKILIPLFMERTEYIIDVIATLNKDLISKDKILNYRRRIIANDHLMTRINDSTKKWKHLIIKYYVIPGAAAFFIKNLVEINYPARPELRTEELLGQYVWVFSFTTILGLSITLAKEAMLYFKTKKQIYDNPNDTRRNLKLEAATQKVMNYFYYIVMFLTIFRSLLRL